MKPEDVEAQLVGETLEAPSGEPLGVFKTIGFDPSGGLHASVSSDDYSDFKLVIEPYTTDRLLAQADTLDSLTDSLGSVVARLIHDHPNETRYEVSLQTPPGSETGPYGDPNKKPPKKPS